MSDILDGLGTAAEGGLWSRVIEPPSGARAADPHQSAACLNCGAPLAGAFCHACGQPGHVHRTIGAFLHDLLHGALHFEGRLWRTLPMLAFRPGALTRRYIEGQRARFVSPMALFLFGVFLMFAVFQMLGLTAPTEITPSQVSSALVDDSTGYASDAAEPPEGWSEPDFSSQTGIDLIDNGIIKKWQANPGLLLYKLQSNSYKFSWLLIPLSVPLVALLFLWRRQYGLYDHAIFVTYSLSFMSLLFVAISLLSTFSAGETVAALAACFVPPLHMYRQLRGAYQLSRFSALWRLAMLLLFIMIVIALFLQVLLVLGAF